VNPIRRTNYAFLAMAVIVIGSSSLLPSSSMAAAPIPAGAAATDDAKTSRPEPSIRHASPAGTRTGPASRVPDATLTAPLDSTCDAFPNGSGELCLWYYAGYQGSRIDFWWGADNLANNRFLSAGSGQGAIVANNSESVWNYDSSYTAWVCTNAYQQGVCGTVAPHSGGNFITGYWNNVESFHWV
jgi:hypothetical protein